MIPLAARETEPTSSLPEDASRPLLRGKVLAGLGVVAAIVAFGLVVPLVALPDPSQQDLLNNLAEPSWAHLLGTDALGRDVAARLIEAITTDLTIGFLAASLPMLIGSVLGAVAGFRGGWVDTVIMRSADVVQAFPLYIFMIAVVFALGAGVGAIIVAFTVVGWVGYARLLRAEVLRIRHLDYVTAALAGGLSRRRVLVRHVIPNAIPQTIVFFAADVLFAILSVSAFSFLGLGVPPETPEWGTMIAEGRPYIRTHWWLVAAPGAMVALTGVGLMLVADGLDDRFRTR